MISRESARFAPFPANGNGHSPRSLMYVSELKTQLPTIAESAEEPPGGQEASFCLSMSLGSKPQGRRSKSTGFSAEEDQTGCLSSETASQNLCLRSKSCRPRAVFSLLDSFFNCWHQKGTGEKGLSDAKVVALLELSRRQQEQLADKQDTIDMLEWQLEQLQVIASKEGQLQDKEEAALIGSKSPNSSPFMMKPPSETSAPELLFEMAIIRATISIRCFCKVFMKQMEVSGYSVWKTLSEMDPQTTFLRKEHTAFALEAQINRALFHSFENDSFDDSGMTWILDPANRCIVRMEEFKRMKLLDVGEAINPNHSAFEPDFFRFCESKTREMWALFPWNIIFRSSEERAVFTGSFLEAAKGVWLLHKLAFSMNPEAGIIRVGRGMATNPNYVEAVAILPELCKLCQSSAVEFMVMPGFRALKTIKCQFYPHVLCK